MSSKKHKLLFLSILIIMVISYYETDSKAQNSQGKFFRLEPEAIKDIDDPPWNHEVFPSNIYEVNEVLAKGIQISHPIAYDNPDWKRQAYKSYWHSSMSRWSYIPHRIHYAMHRLFVTYRTGSIYFDFIHNLGIADESAEFNYEESNTPYEYLTIVAMQSSIKNIIAYGNQIVIVSKPRRNGLQVLEIPLEEIIPSNENENILIQLVTELGDEIDYCLINYVNPKTYPK